MRLAFAGLAVLALVEVAAAADYGAPVLRGSNAWESGVPAYRDWSGFYAGGHVGYSSGTADFGDTGSDLIADILRNTLIEDEFDVSSWVSPGGHGNGTPVGFFMGYNWQSEDTVFGIDITYSRTSIPAGGSDALARNITTSDDTNYDVFASATMMAKITDILSMRARGGVTFGSFMPYGTLGVAVGRVDIVRSATVTTIEYNDDDPPVGGPPQTVTASDSKKGAFAFGLSAGLGFDWEIFPRMFLRGEYEYVAFAPVKDVQISIHTARGGVGVRF